ncbi:MAG TPA: hypothetical protein VFQ70_03930 [Candidatus Saccharimonadaceae bacterium]|nr:hypothetical protein [Candidatus Saccharimonadaceae bacterium]
MIPVDPNSIYPTPKPVAERFSPSKPVVALRLPLYFQILRVLALVLVVASFAEIIITAKDTMPLHGVEAAGATALWLCLMVYAWCLMGQDKKRYRWFVAASFALVIDFILTVNSHVITDFSANYHVSLLQSPLAAVAYVLTESILYLDVAVAVFGLIVFAQKRVRSLYGFDK